MVVKIKPEILVIEIKQLITWNVISLTSLKSLIKWKDMLSDCKNPLIKQERRMSLWKRYFPKASFEWTGFLRILLHF